MLTRKEAQTLLSQFLPISDVFLPDYVHFELPVKGVSLALWCADDKDSIICELTIQDPERSGMYWRLGDQRDMAPVWLDGVKSGFRNDFFKDKEGFSEWMQSVMKAVLEHQGATA